MSDLHSRDQVLHDLRKACATAGSQSAWAQGNNVSDAYLSDVLNFRRDPGEAILSPLGYEKVTLYKKVKR